MRETSSLFHPIPSQHNIGPIPSEGMLDVCKALENNTTLKTLTMQQGPGKYFDSSIETAFKSRVCNNKSLLKINIGPLRSNDVRGALEALPKTNEKAARTKVAVSVWEGERDLLLRSLILSLPPLS